MEALERRNDALHNRHTSEALSSKPPFKKMHYIFVYMCEKGDALISSGLASSAFTHGAILLALLLPLTCPFSTLSSWHVAHTPGLLSQGTGFQSNVELHLKGAPLRYLFSYHPPRPCSTLFPHRVVYPKLSTATT